MIVFGGVVLLVFVGQLLIERLVNPRNNILGNVTELAKAEVESLTRRSAEAFAEFAERLLMQEFVRTISTFNFLRRFNSLLIEILSIILAIGGVLWLLLSAIRFLFR